MKFFGASTLINKIHLTTFPPSNEVNDREPALFRKETMRDMNFLENNIEIRYSKEPKIDFDILNNKKEVIELENLSLEIA